MRLSPPRAGSSARLILAGNKSTFAERGLIPRVLSQCFRDIQAYTSKHIEVRISYLEVYNEAFFDLLDAGIDSAAITISERNGQVAVRGASQVAVDSEAAALRLLFDGEAARAVGEHALNRESSRSHSIFTIELAIKNDPNDPQVCSKG